MFRKSREGGYLVEVFVATYVASVHYLRDLHRSSGAYEALEYIFTYVFEDSAVVPLRVTQCDNAYLRGRRCVRSVNHEDSVINSASV